MYSLLHLFVAVTWKSEISCLEKKTENGFYEISHVKVCSNDKISQKLSGANRTMWHTDDHPSMKILICRIFLSNGCRWRDFREWERGRKERSKRASRRPGRQSRSVGGKRRVRSTLELFRKGLIHWVKPISQKYTRKSSHHTDASHHNKCNAKAMCPSAYEIRCSYTILSEYLKIVKVSRQKGREYKWCNGVRQCNEVVEHSEMPQTKYFWNCGDDHSNLNAIAKTHERWGNMKSVRNGKGKEKMSSNH